MKNVPSVKKGFKPVRVRPTPNSSVSVAEHQGLVEVVLVYGDHRLRLLGTKEGIHVGAVVEK
jgi:hypothetical protein